MDLNTLRLRLELLNDICAELEDDFTAARAAWLDARRERHLVANQIAALLVTV